MVPGEELNPSRISGKNRVLLIKQEMWLEMSASCVVSPLCCSTGGCLLCHSFLPAAPHHWLLLAESREMQKGIVLRSGQVALHFEVLAQGWLFLVAAPFLQSVQHTLQSVQQLSCPTDLLGE